MEAPDAAEADMLTKNPVPGALVIENASADHDALTPGIVRVRVRPWSRRSSSCSCGWRGRRRVMRSRSVLDALLHAASRGCHPAVPLVDVDIGRRP